MKKMRWVSVAVLAFALAVTAGGAAADADKDDEVKLTEEQQKAEQLLEDELTARKLADYARGSKGKAPEAYLAAAAMFLKINDALVAASGKTKAVEQTDEKGKAVKGDGEEKTLVKEAEALIEYALAHKENAKLRKELTALAKSIRERGDGARALSSGPKRVNRKVDAGKKQQFTVKYGKGDVAMITMHSNHPVRLVIKNAGSDISNNIVTSYKYTFKPRGNGSVIVQIHGTGRPAEYTVVAN